MKVDFDALTACGMKFARALGFIFLVYFIPVFLRDGVGGILPGGGILGLLTGGSSSPLFPALWIVVTCAVSLVAVILYARIGAEERTPLPLVSFHKGFRSRWGVGFLGGIAVIVAAHLILYPVGAFSIEGFSRTLFARPDLTLGILVALLAESLREELAFRGPAQRDLTHAIGFPLAAIFLSGSFTLLHLANPNAESSSLLGVFLAGLALAGIVRAEGDLALAAGLHAGWNIALGMIASMPVSGIRLGSRLLEVTPSDDPRWSGGHFGFEASWPGIIILFVAGFLAWRWRGRAAAHQSLALTQEATPESTS